MEIYFAFMSLLCGYLLYQTVQLRRKIQMYDEAHKKSLTEAGNAITDTLRIAFDNLKRNSGEHNKINTKLTEHNSRIHRLEQHINRKPQEIEKKPEYLDEDAKILRKKQKE